MMNIKGTRGLIEVMAFPEEYRKIIPGGSKTKKRHLEALCCCSSALSEPAHGILMMLAMAIVAASLSVYDVEPLVQPASIGSFQLSPTPSGAMQMSLCVWP